MSSNLVSIVQYLTHLQRPQTGISIVLRRISSYITVRWRLFGVVIVFNRPQTYLFVLTGKNTEASVRMASKECFNRPQTYLFVLTSGYSTRSVYKSRPALRFNRPQTYLFVLTQYPHLVHGRQHRSSFVSIVLRRISSYSPGKVRDLAGRRFYHWVSIVLRRISSYSHEEVCHSLLGRKVVSIVLRRISSYSP